MKVFIPFFLFFIIVGCKERSPLSDVEVSDPGLISPEITLTQSISESGRTETKLIVYLNDDNNNSIDLLKGGVALNGTPLGVRTGSFGEGDAPYYSLDGVQLIPKTKYSFQITLADDRSYSCIVTSPKQLISGVTVPEYHNMNRPLTVSWNKFSADKRFNCVLEISSDGELKKEIDLNSSDVRSGKYVIGSSVLREINTGERSDFVIALTSTNSGKIDPKFDGGSIKIIQTISKQVTIDEGDSDMESESDGGVSAYNHKNAVEKAKKEDEKNSSGISWLKLALTGAGGLFLGYVLVTFFNKRKAKKQ